MSEIILDSVIDSIKLLPFLFLTYLFMEWLEHKTGAAARKRIRTAGKRKGSSLMLSITESNIISDI